MPYKIDLHIHSNLSDSSLSPKEIIDEAASKNMIAIAITDHDTFAVTKELQMYAKDKGITLIPGIEISCMDETTKRKVHILGYGFNDRHEHINQLLAPFKQHLTKQRLKLLPILNNMGFDITEEEVLKHEILYKQDYALAMERKGYGKYKEIFTSYFFGPNSIESHYPITFNDVKEAIEAIHNDGGIAVLAHPRTYNTFNEIEKYIGWGLDGIEICHPSFIEGDLERIMDYPLLHFGGSDNHGTLNLTKKRVTGDYGISVEDYHKIKDIICHDIEINEEKHTMEKFAIIKKEDPLSNLRYQQLKEALSKSMHYDEENPDIVICIGGDGTIINAVHHYMAQLDKVCFVGVHTGTLGFYTDYNADEWTVLVNDILNNPRKIDHRCLLKVESESKTYYALNEMSLEESHCSLICDVYINGEYLECFRGYGLCISTPSGSTALNRSLGGAVVAASIPSMQLTEIAGIHHNAYRSLSSSLVLSADSTITLAPQMGRRMTLGVDRDVYNYNGTTKPIKVTVADRSARFIRFRHHGLCQRLRKAYIN